MSADLKTDSVPYKYLNDHEAATLTVLADLIIPADERSQGGAAGGAEAFIDLLADSDDLMKTEVSGGLRWLDSMMLRRCGCRFIDAGEASIKETLDLIAYARNAPPELEVGVRFFALVRRLVVDCFFTSREGIRDLRYMGNDFLQEFKGCGEQVVLEIFNRSPLGPWEEK
jgi:Gluconate 2-dehydrogenase subunit 3